MTNPLTHFDQEGQAHMVDVDAKNETHRIARAEGSIRMNPETLALIVSGTAKKGDVLGVARIAAIPQVRAVNPYRPPTLTNNVATGIIHADVLHNDHGLDGRDQIVGIADTGLDSGVNDATMHDDFERRIVSIYALGRPGDPSDIHNHGTHVAGSVLGNGAMSNGNIL